MSSDRSQWLNTKLVATEPDEVKPSTASNAATDAMHSISSPLVRLADQFGRNSSGHHFDLAHFDLPPDADLHQPPTPSSEIQCSNPNELQDQPYYHHTEHRLSLVEGRESEQQHHLAEDNWTYHDLCRLQQEKVAATNRKQPSNLFIGVTEPSSDDGMSCHYPKAGVILASPSIICSTRAAMPEHLPEPPESVCHVILPERGKLLQAVMQAGPLLQTLLEVNPLPQWRQPTPPSDAPKITLE